MSDLPTSDSLKPVRWAPVCFLALILIALNTAWIANSEMRTGVTEITISTLFIGVTFILFLCTLGNLVVRRFWGRGAGFNQPELMMLYSMLSISSVVAGVGHMGFFTPFLVNPFWFANDSNGWKSLWGLLPPYIGPRDPAVLKGFFTGHSTFFQWFIVKAWAFPLVVWGLFFLLLLWMTLCLAVIVRQRWSEEEHLPFPVIALPLEMTREGAPLYRTPLLWLGFAIPCVFHSVNSLHSLYPLVPSWPINSARDLVAGLPSPWSGLEPLYGGVHPAGVGFGYLINTDVLFSMWFLYLVRKAMDMVGIMAGWRDVGQGQFGGNGAQFPYTAYQSWGAWLAFGVGVLWQGRGYFVPYFRSALHGGRDDARQDPLSPRTAVVGFAAGFLALCLFIWSSGGSWWAPVAFMAIYFILMVALARLQGETAVLSPDLVWVDPQTILTGLAGTGVLSRMDAVHIGILSWFNMDYRAASLPHQLQGFVAQKRAGGSFRGMAGMLMAAAAVALLFSLVWDLQLYYTHGAATPNVNQWRISMGSVPWNSIQHWIRQPSPVEPKAIGGAVAGALITGGLSVMRTRFFGFPLAPAAYVLNTSWANDLFWLDMLIAWVLKVTLLRWGGMKFYREGMPFFLGLILGDFVTGSFWSLIGAVMGLDLFRTFST